MLAVHGIEASDHASRRRLALQRREQCGRMGRLLPIEQMVARGGLRKAIDQHLLTPVEENEAGVVAGQTNQQRPQHLIQMEGGQHDAGRLPRQRRAHDDQWPAAIHHDTGHGECRRPPFTIVAVGVPDVRRGAL